MGGKTIAGWVDREPGCAIAGNDRAAPIQCLSARILQCNPLVAGILLCCSRIRQRDRRYSQARRRSRFDNQGNSEGYGLPALLNKRDMPRVGLWDQCAAVDRYLCYSATRECAAIRRYRQPRLVAAGLPDPLPSPCIFEYGIFFRDDPGRTRAKINF